MCTGLCQLEGGCIFLVWQLVLVKRNVSELAPQSSQEFISLDSQYAAENLQQVRQRRYVSLRFLILYLEGVFINLHFIHFSCTLLSLRQGLLYPRFDLNMLFSQGWLWIPQIQLKIELEKIDEKIALFKYHRKEKGMWLENVEFTLLIPALFRYSPSSLSFLSDTYPINASLCLSNILVCVAFHWSIVDLTGVLPLERTNPSCPWT